MPQVQREDLGGLALLRCGLHRLPLHQVLLMRKPLQLTSERAPIPPR